MVNLFYKSNQQRLRTYNEQRKLDLINQLKQKEKIRAINDEEIYNDELADQLAKIYAGFLDKSSAKESILALSAPTPAPAPVTALTPAPVTAQLPAPVTAQLPAPAPRKINLYEKKRIDSLTVPLLKDYLVSKNIIFKTTDRKKDLRQLAYDTLPTLP